MVDIMDYALSHMTPMPQASPVDQDSDRLTQLQQAQGNTYAQPAAFQRSPVMQMASVPSSPSSSAASGYTPTTGAQMEADSHSSIDDLMAQLAAQRNQYRAQDAGQQWMSFFSKLAASKNPRLLGGLGEGAEALTETRGKQQANNQLLDQAALQDQIKYREWQQDQQRQQQLADQTGAYQTGELANRNAALAQTGEYQRGELARQNAELALRKIEANKPIFDKLGNPWQLDPETNKYVPVAKDQMAQNKNIYGYEIGSVPPGTSAPVIDPKFDPTLNMDITRKSINAQKTQDQLEKDNAAAAINNDAITRLQASKNTIMSAPTGGLTNLIGIGPIATAFSTQRQEMDALNKELAMAPGERPTNMRLTQGEVMMLKQAQPGTDKSPEANAAIADANIAIRSRPLEFANFKNDFVANNGYWNDAVGQQMYNQYIKENPIIDVAKSGKGVIALNQNRQTIEQYANNGGFKRFGVIGNPQANQQHPSPSGSPASSPTAKSVHFNDLPD